MCLMQPIWLSFEEGIKMKNEKHTMIDTLKKADRFVYFISKAAAALCGMILVGMVLIICSGVFNRLFIHQSWMFVEEWTGLALIPMSYLGFGYTLRYNKHLKMDLLVMRMSFKWQNIFAIFSAVFSIICLVYFVMFSYNWLDYCISRNTVSSGPMQTPLWIFSLTILIGCVIMTLDMVGYLISRIIYAATGESPFHFHDQIGEED